MIKAVEHAHSLNVVHRDIKLENFLVDFDQDSEKIIVKLTDFGLSKEVQPGAKYSGRSGTLVTMAPEMINNNHYWSKVDVWSLGVVLFELLTNELPFYSNSKSDLAR